MTSKGFPNPTTFVNWLAGHAFWKNYKPLKWLTIYLLPILAPLLLPLSPTQRQPLTTPSQFKVFNPHTPSLQIILVATFLQQTIQQT
jgi:hypothetical protein